MEPGLARTARSQHGVFSRLQARQAGYSDRQLGLGVKRGDWVKCTSAVFLVVGAPNAFLANAWVAILAAGEGAMLSHRVAGQLHKLDGVPAPVMLDLYVPARRRPRDVPRARLHRVDVGPSVRCSGLPVARLPLTVVDLPASFLRRTGFESSRTHYAPGGSLSLRWNSNSPPQPCATVSSAHATPFGWPTHDWSRSSRASCS